jgi:hypothetical protein
VLGMHASYDGAMAVAGGTGGDDSLDNVADRIVARHLEDQPGAMIAAMSEFRDTTGASLLDAREAIARAYERRSRLTGGTGE